MFNIQFSMVNVQCKTNNIQFTIPAEQPGQNNYLWKKENLIWKIDSLTMRVI